MLVAWVVAVCALGVAAGSILPHSQVHQDQKCEPGAVWVPEEGCGTCYCLQQGVPACWRVGCGEENQSGSEAPVEDQSASEEEGPVLSRRRRVRC